MGALRLRALNMGTKEGECDIAIIGAGFAGLFCAWRLSQLGYRVVVLEATPTVMGGASLRNEGWLHAGTYHSVSIKEPQEALAVAARCLYGHQLILSEFRDCVELDGRPTFAVVGEGAGGHVTQRWEGAGVAFRAARQADYESLCGYVNIGTDERLYEVADRGIDVRILGARLVKEIRKNGGLLVTGATVTDQSHQLKGGVALYYTRLIIAAGYATTNVCRDLSLDPPAVRLWRSHLLTGPSLAPASVFGVEPGEAAMVNHGPWSIVGLNEDAEMVPEPTFEPDPVISAQLRRAVASRFPGREAEPFTVTACVKVDLAYDDSQPRSLMLSVRKLSPEALVVFPGKMTEAPYTAAYVSRLVLSELGHRDVPDRLIDTFPPMELDS